MQIVKQNVVVIEVDVSGRATMMCLMTPHNLCKAQGGKFTSRNDFRQGNYVFKPGFAERASEDCSLTQHDETYPKPLAMLCYHNLHARKIPYPVPKLCAALMNVLI